MYELRLGIDIGRVIIGGGTAPGFCRERPQKADHARELLLTHFIDDRVDVLRALRGVVPRLVLFGPQRHPVAPAAWLASAPDGSTVRGLLLDAHGKVRNQIGA